MSDSEATTSPEDRSFKLKCQYINLLDETEAIGACVGTLEKIRLIDNVVDKANRLLEDVTTVSELVLDAHVINEATKHLQHVADNMDLGEGVFDLNCWANQFKEKAEPIEDQSPCQALCSAAQVYGPGVPTNWTPLQGGFDDLSDTADEMIPKEKKKQERTREAEAEKSEPERVVEVGGSAEGGTEQIVQEIYLKLKRLYRANDKEPINYFRFVIDPTSFGKTVENIFHVSFLVHDNHARLSVVDGALHIGPLSVRHGKENGAEKEEAKQLIIPMDMASWRRYIEDLNIESAMI